MGPQKIDLLAWFTMPSVYELLPAPGDAVLIDTSGRVLALDIYDIRTWIENSWGVFDPARRAIYRKVLAGHVGGLNPRA